MVPYRLIQALHVHFEQIQPISFEIVAERYFVHRQVPEGGMLVADIRPICLAFSGRGWLPHLLLEVLEVRTSSVQ